MNLDKMDLSVDFILTLYLNKSDLINRKFFMREVFGRKTFCTIAGHQACGLDISECSEPECVIRLIHES